MAYGHICGFYYIIDDHRPHQVLRRKYLPQIDLSVHSTIVASTSRTTLTQNFINPLSDKAIPELRYTFPLYDGVSVVGFTCTINKTRIIKGVVKERNEARKTYDQAVAQGGTAGLLEQLPDASDVFTTTVGNVPSGAEIKVEVTYLGELKHDAGVNGIRFTVPTSIAPRYGDYPGELVTGSNVSVKGGIKIVVDAEMPRGSNITSIKSPSHPIAVTIGNTSAGAVSGADMSLEKASATLSLGTAELDKDFVLQVIATDTGNPIAVLETHPTLPSHRAIMATLVPKYNIPSSRPEIVFLCDRSGSMGSGQRIPNLKAALQIFLKSLPLGVKFNVCSFGSRHELLFKNGSVSYSASSLEQATKYVDGFAADYGGTEMYRPLEDVIQKRYEDMDLEVFLLTDGDVWNQENLVNLANKSVHESKGSIRIFTLGIGDGVSHALIEGVARAGNGFSQTVMDNESMNAKVLRMLKAALTPHIMDYTLDIKYEADSEKGDGDSDFEIIEKVMDALNIDNQDSRPENKGIPEGRKETISLFDPAADLDVEMKDASKDTSAGGKYAGVPPISEPKLLQAPFVIPPLYAYNRTSVYLLLPPESVQKTPKSIVLKGTSAHGPLELEIPITILPEKAETIHQLAARQAIRELEDGRGWIFHAKDAGDGTLLRGKFPGRFSDMVEREAVRLGVKFQVGGKWSSFVAVEESPGQTSENEPLQETVRYAEMRDLVDHGQQAAWSPQAILGAGEVRFQSSSSSRKGLSRGFHALDSSRNARSASSTVSAAFGATRVAPAGGHAKAILMQQGVGGPAGFSRQRAGTQMGYGALAHHAHPTAPIMGRPTASSPPTRAKRASHDVASGGMAPAMSLSTSDSDLDGEMGFAIYDEMEPLSRAAQAQSKDPFETVVALQTFEGYWKWADELFDALKISGDRVCLRAKMSSNQAIAALGSDLTTKSDRLATAIVLAWLETEMKGQKDEWEMMADKAWRWLGINMSEGVAGSYVSAVRDMVASLDDVAV